MRDRISFAKLGQVYLEAAILDALYPFRGDKNSLAKRLRMTGPHKEEIVGAILNSLESENRVWRPNRIVWELTDEELRRREKL